MFSFLNNRWKKIMILQFSWDAISNSWNRSRIFSIRMLLQIRCVLFITRTLLVLSYRFHELNAERWWIATNIVPTNLLQVKRMDRCNTFAATIIYTTSKSIAEILFCLFAKPNGCVRGPTWWWTTASLADYHRTAQRSKPGTKTCMNCHCSCVCSEED